MPSVSSEMISWALASGPAGSARLPVDEAGEGPRGERSYVLFKRALDLVLSGATLLMLSTLLPSSAALMLPGRAAGALRRSRFGRGLHRLRYETVPQLISVFTGHATLVGAHPAAVGASRNPDLAASTGWPLKRGWTGLWRISGKGRSCAREMSLLDLHYARHRSLRLDLEILLRTIPVALSTRQTL
jgi:lipopolysaccharide/colanic/teichoic acid biosynthesis glycosyltransferase